MALPSAAIINQFSINFITHPSTLWKHLPAFWCITCIINVCLQCVSPTEMLCKSGWNDRDAVWMLTVVGPRSHVLDGANIGGIHSQLREVTRQRCGLLPNYFGHLFKWNMLELIWLTILFVFTVGDDGVRRVRKRLLYDVEGNLQSIFMMNLLASVLIAVEQDTAQNETITPHPFMGDWRRAWTAALTAAAEGWPLMWVNRLQQVSHPDQFRLFIFSGSISE